ncbi:UNVERIFIED_CONTAM: hypothetical protein FKN15_006422 [Acipenser sinensis]
MNHKNERRVRAKEASLRKELATAAKKAVNIDISKIKKRGHSVSSLNDDVLLPMAVCVSARIPAKPLHVLEAHELGINAVKFSPTSKLLATGGTDCIIKLWDVIGGNTQQCVLHCLTTGYSPEIINTVINPLRSYVGPGPTLKFSLSGPMSDPIWHHQKDVKHRAASCTQEVPLQGKVTSLEISPDHTQLLSCSRDECLQVIDLRMNNIRKSFSPDGSYVTAGSSNGAVYVWNVNSGLLETCLPEQHSSSVNAVSWSLSGEYVVSVDRSRRAVLWSDI